MQNACFFVKEDGGWYYLDGNFEKVLGPCNSFDDISKAQKEKELEDVNKRLSVVRGYNRTLRLEAEKAEILRQLGKIKEAQIIEEYIKKYK